MRSSVKCAPPRYPWLQLLTSAALLATSSPRAASGTDLVADVGKALDRLATVDKPFSLVPGVRVVKREIEHPGVRKHRVTLVDSAERVFRDHDLVLDAAPGLEMRVTAAGDGQGFRVMAQPSSRSEPRTFGVMRRLKMALLPIMYKLGVITTLLTLLTVFALKGLTIGVLLLIMGSVGLAHKFKVPYHDHGGPQKDVHVHVHGGGHHAYSSPIYHSAESPWDRNGPQAASGQPWGQAGPQAAPGQPWGPPPGNPSNWRYPHQLETDQRSPWEQFIS